MYQVKEAESLTLKSRWEALNASSSEIEIVRQTSGDLVRDVSGCNYSEGSFLRKRELDFSVKFSASLTLYNDFTSYFNVDFLDNAGS
ncbi:hypothetical protein GDO81_023231 [Engystomops pustulosus]|uniref:Uncharacterized protein n=1 Tax=Engystomops pustulosus TaxID=76066 RepID=A0AAV6YQ26_ENGPU|nr:hypothetical protein GDO81_023231 [Engystomops pustulosus]